MTYAINFDTKISASALYAEFHAVERYAAQELAEALPFMVWAPNAVKLADVARHEAIALGKMARVEFEIWGGMPRLLRVLRHAASQISQKALHATVYVGYMLFVAFALAYHYGAQAIADYVERSQQVSPVATASEEVLSDMEGEWALGAELMAKLTGQAAPDGEIKISLVEPLPTDESGESSDVALSTPDTHPVIVEEPIDWSVWSADDLRLACLRNAFNIPLRAANKKVLAKQQLVACYSEALSA